MDAGPDQDASLGGDADIGSDAGDSGSDAEPGDSGSDAEPGDSGSDGGSDAGDADAGTECDGGYEPSGDGVTCTDIDECTLDTDNCSADATCTNTAGSFECACNAGYSGDGVTCTDDDECALDTDNCSADATCANTAGSFECACNAGYSGDGVTCTDDDECALDTDNCSADATCANTAGSFECACNAGYSGDGVTCTDDDECALDTDNCSADATCANTAGSFECACNAGYSGDGVTCTADLCSAATDMAVGDVLIARPEDSDSVCIENTSSGTQQYLFIPMNLTTGAEYTLGVTPSSVVSIGGTAAGTAGSTPGSTVIDAHRPAHLDEVASRIGISGTGTPLSPPAAVPSGVPTVGASWTLNGEMTTACESGTARTGTVVAVGTHAIFVEDDSNPPGGFVLDDGTGAPDYTSMLSAFDDFIYPGVTGLYGAPTDMDANSRVVVFFTRALNELSPPSSSEVHPARTLARDLLTPVECPTSNQGEIIYFMAADPTGVVNSNVRTVSSVGGQMSALARELGHLVIDSQRLAAGSPFEEPWLDRALGDIASERAFFEASFGLEPQQNIGLTNLTSGTYASRRVAAFNTYENVLFGEYRSWLQAPSREGFTDSASDSLAQRGMGYAFLRYAGDRHAAGDSGAETDFFYDLAHSSLTGLDNIEDVIGTDVTLWMRDALVAAYVDDSGVANLDVPALPYQVTSWNFRSVFGGLGGFPLQMQSFSPGATATFNLGAGGTASYVRFDVSAGEVADLQLTPPAGTGWDAWYLITRLQ